MFYFLSKFLPLLVYPLGLTCILLIVALFLRHRPTWRTRVLALAILVIWLSGNRIVSMALQRSLERRHPPLSEPVQADAIVVLGGGTREAAPPRPSSEVSEAGDRVLYAARLYHNGVAPVIVVSGGDAPYANPGEQSGAEVMKGFMDLLGVPAEAVLTEPHSHNTYENAVETVSLLRERGFEHIILVTSATHMPRSYAIFRQFEDLRVTPAPTDFQVIDSDWRYYTRLNVGVQLMNLLPQADSILATTIVLKEYIGIVVYHLRGWL
jgi:uncharacterized SAM-binding protein YcdF (DUF218 family)